MAIECYPLVGSPIATELQWSRLARMFSGDGVEGVPSGSVLNATIGTGLNLNIAAGQALLRGMFVRSTTAITKGIATNPSSNPRIDRLVFRIDTSTHDGDFFVIAGTPASNPVPPAETYTDTIFDLPIADVRVEANDTLTTRWDRRPFLPINGMIPCTSQNRPNTRGRPAIAYETDTQRTISTPGDGTWDVGMGPDIYTPEIISSASQGEVTSTTYTANLSGSAFVQPFTTGPSGRVKIGFGAYIRSERDLVHVCLTVAGTGGTTHVGVDDFVIHQSGQGDPGSPGASSNAAIYRTFTLPANGSFNAVMRYRVQSGTGRGVIGDRWIEKQLLP